MDQYTRVYYPEEQDGQGMDEADYDFDQPYEDGNGEYDGEELPEDGAYAYEIEDELEEEEVGGRFRVAMNVFDMASILMGVVVILALTTLLVSMVSWLRSDIMHSFVLLQSRIQ